MRVVERDSARDGKPFYFSTVRKEDDNVEHQWCYRFSTYKEALDTAKHLTQSGQYWRIFINEERLIVGGQSHVDQ
jgi:hypothetical protein